MKTVNGGLLIVIAFFVLWIGVTGRFPALIAAIGLVRGTAPKSPDGSSGKSSTMGSGSLTFGEPGFVGPPDALHAPITAVWSNALKSLSK
jgi:hypothetical protein